jgi:hypothetical protein
MKSWYYYLHENGDLIGRNPVAVDRDSEYFNSPFVQKVWKIDLEDRADAWMLVLEAAALGASPERVKELSTKWHLTFEDSIEMLQRMEPNELMKKGLHVFIKTCLNSTEQEYFDRIKSSQAQDHDLPHCSDIVKKMFDKELGIPDSPKIQSPLDLE